MSALAKILKKFRQFTGAKHKAKAVRRDGSMRHEIIAEHLIDQHTKIYQIVPEESVVIFENGEDDGYHRFGTKWWQNKNCPYSYQYLSLDSLYPSEYFEPGGGHPDRKTSDKIYRYMQERYSKLFGEPFESVLELGTGGGEITRHFHEEKIDFLAIEGTASGVEQLRRIGIPSDRIQKANLKFLEPIGRRFDLVMCTEVAEHIEPWFASKVVENCVRHSDVVWFSAAKGAAKPHYHHSNEVPLEAWDNLFAHMGHCHFLELSGLASRADRIYMNKKAFNRIDIPSK